jgi:hypothetical protein
VRKKIQAEPIDPTVQVARITRRGAVITAVCSVVAALVGAFAAYTAGHQQSADAPVPSTVTAASPPTPASATGSESASAPGVTRATSSVSAQLRLDAGTGVDIDAAGPHAVEASGPNGDLDLYFNDGLLTATHSALFSYYGKESDAKVGCPKTVANNQPFPGSVVTFVGSQFCLRTSKGAISWFNVNDIKTTNGPTGYLVINYQLFG